MKYETYDGKTRMCESCTAGKNKEEFSESYWICKRCYPKWKKQYDRGRKASLKKLYGITLEKFDELVSNQKGLCAICKDVLKMGEKGGAAVDHDHETGEIRGILCARCNKGLGHFGDDYFLVGNAASYLRPFWVKKMKKLNEASK